MEAVTCVMQVGFVHESCNVRCGWDLYMKAVTCVIQVGFVLIVMVATQHGTPRNLSFSFPDLENAWNLLQKW